VSDLIIEQEFVPEFPLDKLVPHPDNPRIHDEDAIDESIAVNKFQGAVLVQKSTNYLLDGHGRVNSLRRQGAETVPAFVIDCDPAAARRILLARNRVGMESGFNDEALASMLAEMAEAGDLVGTGYEADDVDDLLARLGGPIVAEEEAFQGGYAENSDEAKTRAERTATTKTSLGLREVVLVYKDEDYEQLKRAVEYVGSFHEAVSTSEAVLAGMVNYAKSIEGDNA
jgi:hypothetical protein